MYNWPTLSATASFMTDSQPAYKRILVKLSGEALMGDADYGIDPAVIERLWRCADFLTIGNLYPRISS